MINTDVIREYARNTTGPRVSGDVVVALCDEIDRLRAALDVLGYETDIPLDGPMDNPVAGDADGPGV